MHLCSKAKRLPKPVQPERLMCGRGYMYIPLEHLTVNKNARADIVSQSEARERGLKDEADVIIFSGAETRVDHLTIVQIGSWFQFLFLN